MTTRPVSVTLPTSPNGQSLISRMNASYWSGWTSTRNRPADSANSLAWSPTAVVRGGHGGEVELDAEPAGEGHFRGRDGQPALAEVVAASHGAGLDGGLEGLHHLEVGREVHRRHVVAGLRAFDEQVMAAAELRAACGRAGTGSCPPPWRRR